MSYRTIVADPPNVVDENFDPLAMKWRAVVVLVVAVAVFDILVAFVLLQRQPLDNLLFHLKC